MRKSLKGIDENESGLDELACMRAEHPCHPTNYDYACGYATTGLCDQWWSRSEHEGGHIYVCMYVLYYEYMRDHRAV